MMLRNRDLNVQKNVVVGQQQKQQQQLQKGDAHQTVTGKKSSGGGTDGKPQAAPAAHHHAKRQAAHPPVRGRGSGASGSGGSQEAEPRPKRACSQSDKENSQQPPQQNNATAANVLQARNANIAPATAAVPVSAFSRSLLIDSAKKAENNANNAAGGAAARNAAAQPLQLQLQNKRQSTAAGGGGGAGAPLAMRRRTSALLAPRPTNASTGESSQSSTSSSSVSSQSSLASSQAEEKRADEQKMEQDVAEAEPEVFFDFDKEMERDMSAVSQYAMEIFHYYKHRERFFRVADYVGRAKHPEVTVEVRAKLVDWMVELQETFELNHETLYLGVKLVDMFMDRTDEAIGAQKMQLIASAALFIASKFDERAPPLIDDFIYLAEDTFTRDQLLEMERVLLKAVDFDLGSPLSYRFLRRYARVCKLDMGTLTLARYVLETSLMFLDYCRQSESLIAAASLLLALRMKGVGDWGPILAKYTGHKRADVEQLMWRLNRMVEGRKQHFPALDTIFRKYSHEIFFEVAKTKMLREK